MRASVRVRVAGVTAGLAAQKRGRTHHRTWVLRLGLGLGLGLGLEHLAALVAERHVRHLDLRRRQQQCRRELVGDA